MDNSDALANYAAGPTNVLILEAQANFALNLLREVSKDGRSCIVSPLSVAIALSMVYTGAREETGAEIGQLLAFGAPDDEVHQFFGDLHQTTKKGHNNFTLEVANKVYVQKSFPLLASFKTQIAKHYGGLLEAVNFGDSVGTAKKINKFVENATHDKIHDLVLPGDLAGASLVLVNALYFNADWTTKFDPKWTQKKTFYMNNTNNKEMDMMTNTDSFIHFEDESLQLLGMPYQGDEVFMFIVLPKERFGLDKLLAQLDGQKLLELVNKRSTRKVEVVLPKFKVESTHELKQPLKHMGMPTAFTGNANFGGISEKPFEINRVIQKAFIEVTEQGTEAAAATALLMVVSSAETPRPFIADQPFLAFIVSGADSNTIFGTVFRG